MIGWIRIFTWGVEELRFGEKFEGEISLEGLKDEETDEKHEFVMFFTELKWKSFLKVKFLKKLAIQFF